jgi:hypothetical protein
VNAYADWQVHYETCAKCKPGKLCAEGDRLFRVDVPELSAAEKRTIDTLDALDGAA